MKISLRAIIVQLLAGIIPFAIFFWGFGLAIWLSIVLAVGVIGVFMMGREACLRKKDPVWAVPATRPPRLVLRRWRIGSRPGITRSSLVSTHRF